MSAVPSAPAASGSARERGTARRSSTPARRGHRALVPAVAAWLVLVVIEVALSSVNGWPVADESSFGIVFALAFGGVGAVVAWQRPSNTYGWLLLGMGALATAGSVGFEYGIAGALTWPDALPASDVVGGIGFGVQAGAPWGMLITFFLLLFPDGRLPSARWRPVAWAAAVGITLLVTGMSISAATAGSAAVVHDMTAGVAFRPSGLGRVLSEAGNALNFAVFALAVVSLFVRRRRADPIERRQLRWFAFGAVVLVASIAVPLPEPLWFLFETVATIFLPVAIMIAITRYGLYEIDRLVSRTITYAAVTAVLVGVYALVAIVPSTVFKLESDLLVAAATLAAAAVFVPVRRRVQAAVDRRFNRARYDAQLVLDQFGSQLRDTVDLHGLTGDLHGAIASTVQPSHVLLWLRPGAVK